MTETKKSFNLFSYINMGTIIIAGFLVLIVAMGTVFGKIPLSMMLNDCITRFGRNGVLVLAMLPAIQSGTGPNFGLPVGIMCGLLAECIAIENNFFGLGFLLVSVVLAIGIASIVGYGYGKLMNSVKGSEMTIATYVGFASVGLMNLVWVSTLFRSDKMAWFLGEGLRTTIQLDQVNANLILDNFLAFKLGAHITIPTGTLLVVFVLCYALYLFFRSKSGVAIAASGANPMFARAAGLHVDNNRIIASILTTVLAALGIIIYGQSFGYVQLYDAPMMMAFPTVAAILIGGATAQRAKVFHVILGAFIFNSMLATSLPVINRMVAGTDAAVLTDVIRQVVQNGIILYALMQVRGGNR
ncbi:MAG: ABC transporter permease [Firmicutes bacterium]|nr:ABC transporter permease [Bacillota bacterium]